jgi:hypothetical protein
MAAGALISLTFVVLYGWRSPWRSTAVGRHMMTFMCVLAGVFLLWLAHRLWGPLPPAVWLAALAAFDAVLGWRVVLLWQAQHHDSGG